MNLYEKFDSFSHPLAGLSMPAGSNKAGRSSSTSTSNVNGKKISKKTTIENGKETILTFDNDLLISKTVNGIPEAI